VQGRNKNEAKQVAWPHKGHEDFTQLEDPSGVQGDYAIASLGRLRSGLNPFRRPPDLRDIHPGAELRGNC